MIERSGCPHHEIAALVQQQDGAALGTGHFDEIVDDEAEHLVENQRGVDHLPNTVQAGETIR